MSIQTLAVHIKGRSPLLFHNGRTADPLCEHSKLIKSLTSKRKKVDADYEAIAMAEWRGALYEGNGSTVVVPGENIETMLFDAAKRLKLGTAVKASLLSDGNWPLIYDGPKTIDQLALDPRFRDCRGTRVQRARIMRTRPIFRSWQLKFEIIFDSDDLDQAQIVQILEIAGRFIGIGDYRPKYGRFKVESVKLIT